MNLAFKVRHVGILCVFLTTCFALLIFLGVENQASTYVVQDADASATDDIGETSDDVDQDDLLKNGSLEQSENDFPNHWFFPVFHRSKGFDFELDDDNPLDGDLSGRLDSTEADTSEISFTMLNQIVDPEPFRGKRVRFRAAVRTANTDLGGKAQLWFRVDRLNEDGKRSIGAFDNMGDRPITSDEWKHYEIVSDVEEDADRLTIGMLLIGKATAWIDDASLEIVSDEEATTTKVTGMGSASADAPMQPFFSGWLWLAGCCIGLMLYSQRQNGYVQRFALRFTLIYWLLYSFPTVISGVAGSVFGILAQLNVPVESASKALNDLTTKHTEYTQQAVHWTADTVFGIEGQLVLPNGSGDTTFAYIRLFVCCVLALAVACAWTGIYWRKADQTWVRDILRSYLRYVLALTMLGYGLHKTGFIMTQFAQDSMPREFQMTRTYGESSPMGLLWTFMAASPAYTFFAGLGETVGGLLLVFRRTATIGAFAVFGVMLNVMMLNFCYDVPVKQYSFHLVLMALLVAMPDFSRLANVLIWNKPTEPGNLMTVPYTNRYTVWVPRLIKTVVVLAAFVWPVGDRMLKEVRHYQTDSERQRQEQADSEHLLINRGFRWINEYPYNR